MGMFSARFTEDNQEVESRFRRVHKILVDHGYEVRMVAAKGSESFGDETVQYLSELKRRSGVMLAVCTHHYAEMTSSEFSSYEELLFAKRHGLRVLPLRVVETYPPRPPAGEGHKDVNYLSHGLIDMVLSPDRVFVDCRNKSDLEVAAAIAECLHDR